MPDSPMFQMKVLTQMEGKKDLEILKGLSVKASAEKWVRV